MKRLEPRQEIYDLYWYFAHERNEIFYRKKNGDPEPWTKDPILQKYKFCNSYRVNDRASQYLLRNVIYTGKKYKPEDVIFRIVLFKVFNMPSTWEALEKEFGEITLEDFDPAAYGEFLTRLSRTQAVESTAYMLKPIPGKHASKHANWIDLLDRNFNKRHLAEKLLSTNNMRDAFKQMRKAEQFGNFLSYQYITDISYSDVVNWQENDFTIPGEGAKRGINKVFKNPDKAHLEEAIWWMYDRQEEEFAKRGYNFHKLGGKRLLQPIDCQNIFCETDKYCRVKHPELLSDCKEIKNKYSGKRPPIEYFYPPKWNLDE